MKTREQNSVYVGKFLHMSERQNRSRQIPEDIDIGEFFRIAENRSNKITKKNMNEIREKKKNSKGFDLIGKIEIQGETKKTNMRFRSMKDFESYIDKINDNYEEDELIFTGQTIEYEMGEFKPVKRSNYGKGGNYLADIEEYHGNNCFIPTGNNCFLKCSNYLTGEDYKKEYFEFISNEDRRKNVMTKFVFNLLLLSIKLILEFLMEKQLDQKV